MENLNDLIWTDEDDKNGNSTQSTINNPPMRECCMVCLCMVDSSGTGGSSTVDFSGPTNRAGCICPP